MKPNCLGKKIFVLAFLIVVLVGVFALQGDSFGKGYFTWLKDKLVGIGPELNLAEEDSGLDMSNINIDNLFSTKEDESIIEENDGFEELDTSLKIDLDTVTGVDGGLTMEQVFDEETLPEKKVTASGNSQEELLKIQEEINNIAQKVEIIKIEVQIFIISQELSQG